MSAMASAPKEKIHLKAEQETLLITLYSKAVNVPAGLPRGSKARQILEQLEYDFSALRVPLGTRLTVCLRAMKLDDIARDFLHDLPDCVVLHLGCGLDNRFQRVDNGRVEWYDLDLPDVIALRRRFYEECERCHMIASSVTDLEWTRFVSAQGRPVLVIAEGLLMYLEEPDIKALLLKLQAEYPGCSLAFDAYSPQVVRRISAHPSIQRTGATIQWGIDDARQIEAWGEGIRLNEEWYFDQSQAIARLAFGYRLVFALAALFPAARKAHRILHFNL